MTTKENYVQQVFGRELSRYPAICRGGIPTPTAESFALEFVPPQYDPDKVKDENPDFYDAIHSWILTNHLSLYGGRFQKKCIENVRSMFRDLTAAEAAKWVKRYLALCGRTHEWRGKWGFMGEPNHMRRLTHRIRPMVDDLLPVVRRCLCDMAYRDTAVPAEVLAWMRLMLAR